MKSKHACPEVVARIESRVAAMQAGKAGMFTTAELCLLLSVTKQTISAWVSKGLIPYYRLGTLLRFDPVQLAAWMAERQVG